MVLYIHYRGICYNVKDDPVKDKLSVCFKPLAAAYKEICVVQERCQKPFFGLRDFYRYEVYKASYVMCTVFYVALNLQVGCSQHTVLHIIIVTL